MSNGIQDERQVIIDRLRAEAGEVKDCFTRFAFQGITFASAAVAFMFTVTDKIPLAAFTAVPVIAMLMQVARIGVFKYGTANRNYGYELHLARMSTMLQTPEVRRERHDVIESIMGVRWEEALRAWRVVQPTIFREIYWTAENHPSFSGQKRGKFTAWREFFHPKLYTLNKEADKMVKKYDERTSTGTQQNTTEEYPWFWPAHLTQKAAGQSVYYTGAYLRSMLTVLSVMQYLLLMPLLTVVVHDAVEATSAFFPSLEIPSLHKQANSLGTPAVITGSAARPLRELVPVAWQPFFKWGDLVLESGVWVFGLTIWAIGKRNRRMRRRREILEDEAASIHSCAIIWQCVIEVHLLSLLNGERPYYRYTERLAERCEDVRRKAFSVPSLAFQYLDQMAATRSQRV
jgi:hypothetical protein